MIKQADENDILSIEKILLDSVICEKKWITESME